jgi:ABC-2 type transport system permease protein
VSPKRTLATARRVLTQLRHDPRTIAMLLLVPSLDSIGAPLLAIFPFVTMFLVTSVATLRERASGTLERLLTTPLGKLDLLLGYGIAFGLFATLQVLVVSALSFGLLGIAVEGPLGLVVLVAVIDALLGVALGLLVSAFAATEFQAVQFLPAVVIPQLLLCGLFVPRDRLPDILGRVSDVFPLSYAMDAMVTLTRTADVTDDLLLDVAVTAGAALVALVLAAGTLRRRTG